MTFDSGLPVNLDDLIHSRAIESNRIEFKATWNDVTAAGVVRTASAFANDLLNLNGGYVILGIEEENGRPVLPPRGLSDLDMDAVQKEVRGKCVRIEPGYQPVLFPEEYQGEPILVLWCPGGDNRPYQAPLDLNAKGSPSTYFIRQGPQSVVAKGEFLRQLMESAAKVPFDDRRNTEATLDDISISLVRRFLKDVRSELSRESGRFSDEQLLAQLRISSPVNGHFVPRNVGLLFFNADPDKFFPGARIEVVQFGDDAGGDLIEERAFGGPLNEQISRTLDYLNSMGGALLKKVSNQAEVERTVPYPYEALEEAIVNAVYHRGYDGPPEPVKVYLYPDRMEITSYPGPLGGVSPRDFSIGRAVPSVPARNRRIGEILKELRLAEGRGTGIPRIRRKMEENGSPAAEFDFDDEKSYFRVTLPVHPRYQIINALREAGHLWATGNRSAALDHLRRAFERQPASGVLTAQLIEYAFDMNALDIATAVFERFEREERRTEPARPYLTIARLLLDRRMNSQAARVLQRVPVSHSAPDLAEAAILQKRSGDYEGAHRLFAEAFAIDPDNSKIVHEFAQTKLHIARALSRPGELTTKRRLNKEATELLRRAIQLSTDETRQAWCWYDLARAQNWLRAPESEVEAAYLRAMALLPQEKRFKESFEAWRQRR